MDVFFTLFPYLHKKLTRFVCRIGRKAKMTQLQISDYFIFTVKINCDNMEKIKCSEEKSK